MNRCQCTDPWCQADHGEKECGRPYADTLYRMDMEDHTGVDFCEDCLADAIDSGVFTVACAEEDWE